MHRWGVSYRGGVGCVMEGWGVVGHVNGVGHGGVRCVMEGWGGWGVSWRGGVGHGGVG